MRRQLFFNSSEDSPPPSVGGASSSGGTSQSPSPTGMSQTPVTNDTPRIASPSGETRRTSSPNSQTHRTPSPSSQTHRTPSPSRGDGSSGNSSPRSRYFSESYRRSPEHHQHRGTPEHQHRTNPYSKEARPKSTARQFMQLADLLTSRGYRLGPKIGDGTYATVRIVEREQDGTIMAVKIVDTNRQPNTSYIKHFLPTELGICIGLHHRNAINTREIIQCEGFVFMIMDYAVRGDLLTMIRQNGSMADKDARRTFLGIAQGIKYLHDNNISHRDIKCENIFLMKDKTPVIGDFGFAKRVPEVDGQPCFSTSYCGSMAYASPQLLLNQPYDPKMNDIWGLGCVLFVMMCATMPYDDFRLSKMRRQQHIDKVMFPVQVVDKLHPDCKDLIYKMMEAETDQRILINAVLTHPWLSDVTTGYESP